MRLHSGYLLDNPAALRILKTFDRIGRASARLLKKPGGAPIGGPRKILIAKIDHLGDVLMALQVLPAIKKAYSDVEIDFVCASWSEELLRNNPHIGKILVFDHFQLNRRGSLPERIRKFFVDFIRVVIAMRRERYDIAIDLRGYYPNFIPVLAFGGVKCIAGYPTGGFGFFLDVAGNWREGIHETEHFMELLRCVIPTLKREKQDLDYLVDKDGTLNLLRQWNIGDKESVVLIHAFCQRSNLMLQKQWRMEEWKNIICSLEGKGFRILCSGDREDREPIQKMIEGSSALNCAGLTTIPLLAGLIKRASCVLCIDTLVSHLSAAMAAKTFVLFNGVEPVEQWRPWGDNVHILPIESKSEDLLSELYKTL